MKLGLLMAQLEAINRKEGRSVVDGAPTVEAPVPVVLVSPCSECDRKLTCWNDGELCKKRPVCPPSKKPETIDAQTRLPYRDD